MKTRNHALILEEIAKSLGEGCHALNGDTIGITGHISLSTLNSIDKLAAGAGMRVAGVLPNYGPTRGTFGILVVFYTLHTAVNPARS